MAWTTETEKLNSIQAVTEEGVTVVLSQIQKDVKTYHPIYEINIGANMNAFRALGEICKSSKDIDIMCDIMELADTNNKIAITNISKYAESAGTTRATLNKLLKRAEDSTLLHKMDTGLYLLNPFKLMSKGLTAGGYAAQETAQLKWRELTGLITDKQLAKLIRLNSYLEIANPLSPTEFNISVAEYYAKHGEITDKQKERLIK